MIFRFYLVIIWHIHWLSSSVLLLYSSSDIDFIAFFKLSEKKRKKIIDLMSLFQERFILWLFFLYYENIQHKVQLQSWK